MCVAVCSYIQRTIFGNIFHKQTQDIFSMNYLDYRMSHYAYNIYGVSSGCTTSWKSNWFYSHNGPSQMLCQEVMAVTLIYLYEFACITKRILFFVYCLFHVCI